MTEAAYITLTSEGRWALFHGDGSQPEQRCLAVGPAFESGPAILEAVEELHAWAELSGYHLVTPQYALGDVDLADVIESEIALAAAAVKEQGGAL